AAPRLPATAAAAPGSAAPPSPSPSNQPHGRQSPPPLRPRATRDTPRRLPGGSALLYAPSVVRAGALDRDSLNGFLRLSATAGAATIVYGLASAPAPASVPGVSYGLAKG